MTYYRNYHLLECHIHLRDGGYIDPRLPLLGCRHIGTPPEGASTVSLCKFYQMYLLILPNQLFSM